MGCNCRKNARPINIARIVDQYKYLKPNQIKARLEIFKRHFCSNCSDRYNCDYNMYLQCKKRPNREG